MQVGISTQWLRAESELAKGGTCWRRCMRAWLRTSHNWPGILAASQAS